VRHSLVLLMSMALFVNANASIVSVAATGGVPQLSGREEPRLDDIELPSADFTIELWADQLVTPRTLEWNPHSGVVYCSGFNFEGLRYVLLVDLCMIFRCALMNVRGGSWPCST
jgi:hypothetical protein